jgi:hypothetical protein
MAVDFQRLFDTTLLNNVVTCRYVHVIASLRNGSCDVLVSTFELLF